ncbi:MAG: hypothetical protein Q8N96_10910 [Methylovulum sp.]|nr:hypothetical protein [Methylovulum sp.]
MKNLYLSAATYLLLLPLSMTSLAEQPQIASKPMQGMGNMTEEQKDQHARAIQEHQLQMHELSNKILAEQDPVKKEQLKNQQLVLMKAHHAKMMAGHHRIK